MRKERKDYGLSFLLVFGLLLIGLLATNVISVDDIGRSLMASSQGGWSTLSIYKSSDVFRSSFGPLNGAVWVLNVVQSGLGQYAEGSISADEIFDSQDNKHAEKGFTLKLSETKDSCVYNIYSQSNEASYPHLRDYFIVQWDSWFAPSESEAQQRCAGAELEGWGKVGYDTGFAVCYNDITGPIGLLEDNPSYEFETQFELNVDGSKSYGVLSNKSNNSVLLNDGSQDVAFIQWNGNLVSGDSCEAPSSNGVMALYTNRWRLIDSAMYNTYKLSIQDLRSVILSSNNLGQISEFVENVNNNAVATMVDKEFKSHLGNSGFTTGSNSNGRYVLDLVKSVQFPSFSIYVKADKLGIVTPVAVPRIVSVQDVTFRSGESAYVSALIKNVGDEGGINSWVTCDNSVVQIGNSDNSVYGANQQKTINFYLSGDVGSTTTVNCLVHAKSVNQNEVTKSFGVTISPQQTCNPNQKYCFADVLKQCNSDGTGYNELSNCANENKTCGYENGVLGCVSSQPTEQCGNGLCEYWEQLLGSCSADCNPIPPSECTKNQQTCSEELVGSVFNEQDCTCVCGEGTQLVVAGKDRTLFGIPVPFGLLGQESVAYCVEKKDPTLVILAITGLVALLIIVGGIVFITKSRKVVVRNPVKKIKRLRKK